MGTAFALRVALAVTLCAGMAMPALAGVPEAIEAYDQGDYAVSFAESRPLAEQGDADAQYLLGYLYARGEGVQRDFRRAYMWFTLAAWQGDTIAAEAVAALARRMTREDIAAAETLARDWTPVAE